MVDDDDVEDWPVEGAVSKICRDCGGRFVFSGGERDLFAERSWPDPVRCRACRRRRASERAAGAVGDPQEA